MKFRLPHARLRRFQKSHFSLVLIRRVCYGFPDMKRTNARTVPGYVAGIVLAAALAMGVAAHAADFTGTWKTNRGTLQLAQEGNLVIGRFSGEARWRIEGTTSGNRLEFVWADPAGRRGRGVLVAYPGYCSFEGAWWPGSLVGHGGEWRGIKTSDDYFCGGDE